MSIFRVSVWVLLGSLLAVTTASAASSTVGPVVITIPDGFAQMQSQRKDGAQVTAWTKYSTEGSKTLLQVSVYDFGSKLDPPSPKRLAAGAEHFLRQFLGGIERRRENYV